MIWSFLLIFSCDLYNREVCADARERLSLIHEQRKILKNAEGKKHIGKKKFLTIDKTLLEEIYLQERIIRLRCE